MLCAYDQVDHFSLTDRCRPPVRQTDEDICIRRGLPVGSWKDSFVVSRRSARASAATRRKLMDIDGDRARTPWDATPRRRTSRSSQRSSSRTTRRSSRVSTSGRELRTYARSAQARSSSFRSVRGMVNRRPICELSQTTALLSQADLEPVALQYIVDGGGTFD